MQRGLLLVLLPAAGAAGPVLLRHDVTSDDPLAVCNDGSAPYYYAAPPATADASDSWQIILSGGYGQGGQAMPFCYPPPKEEWGSSGGNCWWGKEAVADPAPNTTLPCGGDQCVYGANCTTNPDFCNFGKVVISSCNLDNWMGDADRVIAGANGTTLHWRGQRVLNATLAQVAKDLLHAGSKVMMMGQEGGGMLLYSMADRIGALLREVAGIQPSNYFVVPVEGLYPRWNSYWTGDVLSQYIAGQGQPVDDPAWRAHPAAAPSSEAAARPGGNAWEYMNMSAVAHPECLADFKNTSDQWQCLLPEIAGGYVRSRIFPLEQLWGTFGSFCLVNSNISYEAAWHGYHLECDLGGSEKNSLHMCVEYGWKCGQVWLDNFVKPYQNNMIRAVKQLGFLRRPGNGLFMHSCHLGNEDFMGAFYNSVKVNASDGTPRSARQALGDWWRSDPSAPSRYDPPCLWNESYSTPFLNNCNPTCPNIAYLSAGQQHG